jgi:hypothetical protein
MARALIQLAFAEDRRVDVLVASASFGLMDVVLDGVADGGARWQPVGQSCAEQWVGIEQLQLAAELAVVAHDGLLADREASDHGKAPGTLAPGLGKGQLSARRDGLRRRRPSGTLHGMHPSSPPGLRRSVRLSG